MKAWALDGLRFTLVGYLIIQGAAGFLLEGSIVVGFLFIVPGIACLAKKTRSIGFLAAALSQVVFIIGFQPNAPIYTIVSQLYIAGCLAWFSAMQKYSD
jgi:hypothetical protein